MVKVLNIFTNVSKRIGDIVDVNIGYIAKEYPDTVTGYWSLHGQSEVISDMLVLCVQDVL